MFDDPIVEEIQKIRDEYATKFNHDLDAIYQDLKVQESQSNRTLVDRPVSAGKSQIQPDVASQGQHAWSDPIVDEIHRVREAYLERMNYDMDAIYRDLKERERQTGRIIVDLSKNQSEQPKGSTEAA